MTEQQPASKNRVRELIAPKEPLLIFRGQSVAVLLPAVLALMAVLGAFFALQTTQRLYEVQESIGLARSELTVFIPSTPGLGANDKDPAINRVLDALQNTSGLGRIEVLDRPQTQLIVEEALGQTVSTEVPLPTIIAVKRARRGQLDPASLRSALDRAAPGAMLDDNRALREHLTSTRVREISKGLAVLVVVLIVASATSALVIGQSVELQTDVLDVLFMSGAPDKIIQDQFLGFALRSALIGAGLGCIVGWLLQVLFWPRMFIDASQLIPLQILVLVAVFLVLTGVSVLAARWNVARKLKRTF